jgi:hypothetical protein
VTTPVVSSEEASTQVRSTVATSTAVAVKSVGGGHEECRRACGELPDKAGDDLEAVGHLDLPEVASLRRQLADADALDVDRAVDEVARLGGRALAQVDPEGERVQDVGVGRAPEELDRLGEHARLELRGAGREWRRWRGVRRADREGRRVRRLAAVPGGIDSGDEHATAVAREGGHDPGATAGVGDAFLDDREGVAVVAGEQDVRAVDAEGVVGSPADRLVRAGLVDLAAYRFDESDGRRRAVAAVGGLVAGAVDGGDEEGDLVMGLGRRVPGVAALPRCDGVVDRDRGTTVGVAKLEVVEAHVVRGGPQDHIRLARSGR